jgi:hypothetical protein
MTEGADLLLRALSDTHATLLRTEALQAAILAELRSHRESPAVDVHALLQAVWPGHQGSVWCVADLRQAGLIDAADARSVGQALARLVAEGGRSGLLRLHRNDGNDRAGRVWRLELLGRL